MKTLSEINREELLALIEDIREKRRQEGLDENGEPAKIWTNEDIDRLLGIANKMKNENAEKVPESIYTAEESFESIVIEEEEEPVPTQATVAFSIEKTDIAEENVHTPDDRIKSIMNDEAKPQKSVDFAASFKSVTGKASSFMSGLVSKGKSFISNLKSGDGNNEERYFLDEDDDFEDDDFEVADGDEDIRIAEPVSDEIDDDFLEEEEAGKTKHVYLEKPGMVIKKGVASEDSDLEGAPTIISLEEEAGKAEPSDEFNSKIRQEEESGQLAMPGFSDIPSEDKPEKIEESEAEKELFKRRKAKIDSFVLFGDENENDPYGVDGEKEKLGDLFDTHEERPRRVEEPEFVGVEYSQVKDARRVRRYLLLQKKKSFHRVIIQSVLLFCALAVSIMAASVTTIGGDKFLTIFSNLIVIGASLITSNQMIAGSVEQSKKKKFNINSAVSVASVLCFVQTLLMLVLYFFKKNLVSVFAGAGVGLLLMSELNSYITFCRTADALELCTGNNKDKLYSIEGITDDKDATELGKNVRSSSPRIRYSGKTRFPSHLIELCTSETSTDKNMRFIALIIAVLSLVNMIVAWAVNRHFTVGFAAFTVTFSLAMPTYAALLVQLPLRWVNKKFNKTGGMISCQEAVSELCRTNAIILDSKDLFDQNMCVMHGFKDFKNVRVDDAMLYAAAMVIRSGGPLMGVFDQMVVNRRDILPTVKSFSYEERLGVSGWINNQKVILGNRTMMLNHNIDVPESIDEDKYLISGHEVIYLAIAHKLAAMMVVDYAPNKKLVPYLKKLRDSGVTVLVRNCDPNVTDRMISECYDMRLDNIKILNSAAGRVFKKYKSRPKVNSRAIAIHDGTTYTFARSLCTAATLRNVFKIANTMMLGGILMSFAIVLILSVLNVIADLPAVFVILLQVLVSAAFIGVTKISCSK